MPGGLAHEVEDTDSTTVGEGIRNIGAGNDGLPGGGAGFPALESSYVTVTKSKDLGLREETGRLRGARTY